MPEARLLPSILYLEDDPDLNRSWARSLRTFGFLTYSATTLEEARELWRAAAGKIDLVILDIDLQSSDPPGREDGGLCFLEDIEGWNYLNPAGHRPAVIILTGFPRKDGNSQRAIHGRVDAFLPKSECEAPGSEGQEPYREICYISALLVKSTIRSLDAEVLKHLATREYHIASEIETFARLCASAFTVGFGRRQWFVLARIEQRPAFLVGSDYLPAEPTSYDRLILGQKTDVVTKEQNLISLASAECVELLSKADGSRVVLWVCPMPETASDPEEPSPLFIVECLKKFAIPEISRLSATVAAAAARTPPPPRMEKVMPKQADKILFVSADPSEASGLGIQKEIRKIRGELQRSFGRDGFIFETCLAARPSDLSFALLEKPRPRFLQFSCHGTRKGAICLEDDSGQVAPISVAALGDLLRPISTGLDCVVLNACYSKIQADAILNHVPYVVGMTDSIDDRAAIAYSVGFYQAIFNGEEVPTAHLLGCAQIRMILEGEHDKPELLEANKAG